MNTYPSFTTAYVDLLEQVYLEPEHVCAPRGMKIKESLGVSFRITNIRHRIPYIPHRELSIAYMIAELVWYLSGNNSTEWISNYSSFWKTISDDGVTANSAYGARIFKVHPYQSGIGWSQWEFIKAELTKDPDSRRAVIHIRMPQDSYFAKLDVPCTLTLQFFIRDGKLHQVASMRSSDLILGLAYDVPAFTFFQELLAFELGVECGSYTHVSNSLHIYERHWPMVEKIIADPFEEEHPWRAREMPPIPSLPPLETLNIIEKAITLATTQDELEGVVSATCGCVEFSYWQDWLFILAAHRANKLKIPQLHEKLMKMTNFSGYSLFQK